MATSVLVAKHSLVFSLAGGEQAPIPEGEVDAFVPEIGGTMMLDTLKQKQMRSGLEQGRSSQRQLVISKTTIPDLPVRNGSVRVVSGASDRSEYSLTAITTIIGKADTAQIRTKGWFKPKVAAAIARKGEGFTVTPMGAAVTVNGQKVSSRQDLNSGDMIEVSGLTLEFRLV